MQKNRLLFLTKILMAALFVMGFQQISVAQVVDLTGSDDPTILKTTLGTVEEGSTIILKRGMTYDITATGISTSVKIMSAEGEGDPAILDPAGSSLDITAGSAIDTLLFKDVEIAGDITAGYLMNFSTDGSISKFILDDVYAHNLRGLFRAKSDGVKTVGHYIINNSVIDSIGGYNVMIMDNVNANCENVVLSNSTFTNIDRVLRWRDASNITSITITDCSFQNASYDGDFLRVEGNATAEDVVVNVTNTIFGASNNKLINGSATVNCTNSFMTTDCGFDAGDFAVAPTAYAGASTDLFADANNSTPDLTIVDSDFEGATTVGDPRWRMEETVSVVEGVYYNIVQKSTGLVVGADTDPITQPAVMTQMNTADQAFQFIPVEGKDNTYLIQNMEGMYLNKEGSNNWTTLLSPDVNGLLSEWVLNGTDQSSITLQVVDNIENPDLGAARSYISTDDITSGSNLYCDKPAQAEGSNGEFMLQVALIARKVAYVNDTSKVMDPSAAQTDSDPIIKLLQEDENFNVDVWLINSDDTLDLSGYDVVVAQEGFSSSSHIFSPDGALGIANIPVPFLWNKAYAMKEGRGFAADTTGAGGEVEGTLHLRKVADSDIFNGITFDGDSIQVFKEGADDDGGNTRDKGLQFAVDVDITAENTLLGSGVNDPENATVCINDIPAGDTIGSEILQARMIAFSMNFGAICKDNGTNFTDEGLTLWRNALYMLAGLEVPETLVDAPVFVKDECYEPYYAGLENLTPDPTGSDISVWDGWGLKSLVYGKDPYCGSSAILLVDTAGTTDCNYPDGDAALDVANFAWKPNTSYHLRAMVKTVDGPIGFLARGSIDNGGGDFGFAFDTEGEWMQLDTIFTTSTTPSTGFFSFNTCDFGSSATKTYIDNYELYELAGPLVSQWKLDETEGAVVTDDVTGATGEVVGEGASWIPGVDGGAINLSTAVDSAWIMVEETEALAPINFTDGALTLSLLAKIDPAGDQQELFIKGSNNHDDGGAGANGTRYEMYAKNGGIYFVIDDDVTKTQLSLDMTDYPVNQWVHLVGVRDTAQDSLYFYLNGELSASMEDGSGAIDVDTIPLLIGNYWNKQNKVRGSMDDILIYNTALSAEEVMDLYNTYTFPAANADMTIYLYTPDERDDTQYDWLMQQGFNVEKVYTASLAANTDLIDSLNAADLVIIGRSPSSGDFDGDDKPAWNNLTVPVILNTQWAARNNRLNWFNSSTAYHANTDPAMAYATIGVPEDEIFTYVTLLEGDSMKWCMAPHDFVEVTEPHNGTTLAIYNGNSPLVTRFETGTEFYEGAVDMPAGPRTYFGFGNDDTGVDNFFPLYEDAQKVYYAEIRRIMGMSVDVPVSTINTGIKKVNSTTAVSVYPNPARDNVNISFSLEQKATVGLSVYTVSGQLVDNREAKIYENGKNTISVNTSDMKSGLYIYRLVVNGKSVTGKISIAK